MAIQDDTSSGPRGRRDAGGGFMSAPARQPAPPQIPAYVRNLNAIAERAGMDVSMYVEPHSSDPELCLWSIWRGSTAQLRATGLLTPYQADRLNLVRAQKYDLNIGTSSHWWSWMQSAAGRLIKDGDQVCYEINNGAADYRIEQRDGVEIIHTTKMTTYHGSREALLALGIEPKRLPIGAHGGKSGLPCTPHYASRRQPDGSIVYRLQTQEDVGRQAREYQERYGYTPRELQPVPKPRPVLRLVVDNTRKTRP